MYQELKKHIVSEVKKVTPKNWKLTFKVLHHSKLVCTIRKADTSFEDYLEGREYASVNHYRIDNRKELTEYEKTTLKNIIKALNCKNHNNSDPMTDYFDVGYYLELSIGSWDKPFIFTE